MIQDSLKVENTPKHYRKERNVYGTTQSPEKTPTTVSKDIMRFAIYYKTQITK